MKILKNLVVFFVILLWNVFNIYSQTKIRENVPFDSILIADPFIYPDTITKTYYMVGTKGSSQMWKSKDLKNWSGPYSYLKWNKNSWIGRNPKVWAPELYYYKGKYYCFVTFTNAEVTHHANGKDLPRRASHILWSDSIAGPYTEINDTLYLPENKCTLDGTLWLDKDSIPYMVYSYEWVQNKFGVMEAIRLTDDLSAPASDYFELFDAKAGIWSKKNSVIDGPFMFKTKTGRLGILWSSWVKKQYAQGVAYSESSTLDGPWIQEEETITPLGYGHGMMFNTFDGKLLLLCHGWYDTKSNSTRYPVLFEMDDSGDKLKLIGRYRP